MSESDNRFDAILKASAKKLLEEDIEIANSIDTTNTVVSKKALRKVRRKIKTQYKDSWWNTVPVACRRTVAAILCVCTFAFCLCMTVAPIRAEFIKIFVNGYEKFAAVFYVSDTKPPNVIEEYREPALQLNGTQKQVVMKDDNYYVILYHANGEQVMMYQQMIITDSSADIDNENCVIYNTLINNTDAQHFCYTDGRTAITWHDDCYTYLIYCYSSNVELDTLITIAESIK